MKPGKPLQRRKPLVAKKALQSTRGLQPGKPIERKSPMVARPKDRAKRAAVTRLRPEAPPNPAYMLRVKGMACIVCRHEGLRQDSPTEAHHIRRDPVTGQPLGASQKAPDEHTIPLCQKRHHWNGVHCASTLSHHAFEAQYGNELALLQETQEDLGVLPLVGWESA